MNTVWFDSVAGTVHATVLGADSKKDVHTEQNPWFTPNRRSRSYGEFFWQTWARSITFVSIYLNMHLQGPAEGFTPSAEGFQWLYWQQKDSIKTVFERNLPPPTKIFRRSKNRIFRNLQANALSTSPNMFVLLTGLQKYSNFNMRYFFAVFWHRLEYN